MKFFALLVAFTGFFATANSTLAQDSTNNAPMRIPAADAKKYLGTNSVVFGSVAEVNIAEKLVRLNFDKPFPNHVFTAVIFASNTNLFPELSKLKGKKVEVTGKITDFRTRPQIVVNSTNQLKVLDADNEAQKK